MFIDMTGQKVNMLTVVRRVENSTTGAKPKTMWLCRCDCGNEVVVPSIDLRRRGGKLSCGCKHRKEANPNIKSKTRLYGVHENMTSRCYNKNDRAYSHYGGRGITICPEWYGEGGFARFYEWAYDNGYDDTAPKGKCTLDRIDNDKGYSPDNCRWVDMKVQMNNRRNNKFYTIGGETKTVQQWCEKYGKRPKLVHRRLGECGWTIEEALDLKKHERKRCV